MSDERDLIEESKKGSHAAFLGLLRLHQGRVRGYLWRYVHSEDAVEDLAQETFLKAYQDLAQYKGESAFSIWLLSIARHRAIDFLREEEVRRSNQGRVLESALARWRADEAALDDRRLDDRNLELTSLSECIHRLPQTSLALIEGHYFQDRELAGLARELGKTEGAVKMILFRIREVLRECLQRRLRPGGLAP